MTATPRVIVPTTGTEWVAGLTYKIQWVPDYQNSPYMTQGVNISMRFLFVSHLFGTDSEYCRFV